MRVVVLLLAWAASASAFSFAPSALSATRPLPAMAVAGRPARLALRQGSSAARMMAGKAQAKTEFPSGKEMPFTLEMRNAAMALHTFSQAPKSGKVKDTSANTQVPTPRPPIWWAYLGKAQLWGILRCPPPRS